MKRIDCVGCDLVVLKHRGICNDIVAFSLQYPGSRFRLLHVLVTVCESLDDPGSLDVYKGGPVIRCTGASQDTQQDKTHVRNR